MNTLPQLFGKLFLISLIAIGCSSRKDLGFEAVNQLNPKGKGTRSVIGQRAPEQPLYQEQKKVIIKKIPKEQHYGSLWRVADARNMLFMDPQRVHLGQTLLIHLPKAEKISPLSDANTGTSKDAKKDKPAATKPKDDKNQDKASSQVIAEIEESQKTIMELQDRLKNLETIANQVYNTPYIKAKVIEVDPTGDVKVQFRRYSKTPMEEKYLIITANLPRDLIKPKQELSTSDLREISIYQNVNNEAKISSAVGWSDEFTEILNSFNGALTQREMILKERQRLLKDSKKEVLRRLRKLRKDYQKMTDKQLKITEQTKELEKKQQAVAEQQQNLANGEPVNPAGVEDLTGNRDTKKATKE